jgi:glucose/arabinose dehydrogenase
MQQLNINHNRLPARPVLARISILALVLVLLAGCTGPGTPGDATSTAAPTTTQSPGVETSTPEPNPTGEPTGAAEETATAAPTGGAPTQEPPGSVTEFPDPSGFTWAPFLSGLAPVTDMTGAGDGSNRLFVLEKVGRVRLISGGQLAGQAFLDITDRVGSGGSEQGLLGIDFHPDYAQNGLFFVNYTNLNGDSVVAQFSVTADPDLADPQSEQILLTLAQPYRNHNGGGVAFGPDGSLYLSFGDGGSAGDPQGNGQSIRTLLGAILRIDPDLQGGYSIPQNNPFTSGEGLPEIWHYGLRNPWRFSFDSATGDMYIADVGQNQIEEIDYVEGNAGGVNFGWSFYEGTQPYAGQPPENVEFTFPIYEYSHAEGCSVTGGYVYRGQNLPEFQGIYIYGDYCSGNVWGLLRGADGQWQNQSLFSTGYDISSFAVDDQGELYLLSLGRGSIYRLERQ